MQGGRRQGVPAARSQAPVWDLLWQGQKERHNHKTPRQGEHQPIARLRAGKTPLPPFCRTSWEAAWFVEAWYPHVDVFSGVHH